MWFSAMFVVCFIIQEAKNDIELLLSVGSYPIEKSYKIYSKLAKCHFMTRNISEGEAALKKALEHLLNTSGLSPKEMGYNWNIKLIIFYNNQLKLICNFQM